MGEVKNQIMNLFKTKDYSKPERVETVKVERNNQKKT